MDQCKEVRINETAEILRIFAESDNFTELLTAVSLSETLKLNEKLNESFKKMENCVLDFFRNQRSNKSMEFVDSVMYSITVFTTVGYGNVVANTHFSKFLTMFYALCGIPLYIAFISDLGDFIGIKIVHFGQFIRNCIQRCKKKRKLTNEERLKQLPQWLRFLIITVSFFIFMILAMVMTKYVEEWGEDWDEPEAKWSLINSLYFVFTTVALIGFGDIVANHYTFIFILFPFMIVGQTLAALMFYFAQRFIRYEIPHLATNACLKISGRVKGWITGKQIAGSRRESETEQPLVEFEAPGALCVKMDEIDDNPKDAGGKNSKENISNVSKSSPTTNAEIPPPIEPPPVKITPTTTTVPTSNLMNETKYDLNITAKPETLADMLMPCHPGVPEDHSDTISVFAKYRAISPSSCRTEEKTQIQKKTHIIKK